MLEQLTSIFAQIVLDPLPHTKADSDEVLQIMRIVFSLAGAIALLVLVIGGFRYVLSRGDPGGTAKAKGTIIYGIVGLLVVFVAASIVTFVINLA